MKKTMKKLLIGTAACMMALVLPCCKKKDPERKDEEGTPLPVEEERGKTEDQPEQKRGKTEDQPEETGGKSQGQGQGKAIITG